MEEVVYFVQETDSFKHPFEGKNIVFTGGLQHLTRVQAAKRARSCGAEIQGAVTADTNFVVLGSKGKAVSSKHLKAKQYIALGKDIQIIEETDFLWLLELNTK